MSYTPRTDTDARYVNTTGDTMTANLRIDGANKGIHWGSPANTVLMQGGSGNELFLMDPAGAVFRNLRIADPVGVADAATKAYVDKGAFRCIASAFSVANGTVVKAPSFSGVVQDTAFFGVASGTITLKQAGYYIIMWSASFLTGTNATGRNFFSIFMSEGSIYRTLVTEQENIATVTAVHYANTANQTFQVEAFHSLGSAQNVSGNVNCHYLGP